MMNYHTATTELPSGQIYYQVFGSGSPLLHIHGAGGWTPTPGLERLAETHEIYVPIMPGFDGTDFIDGIDSMPKLAGLIAEFIDVELDGKVDVLGHSFGGWVASWLTVLDPEKVAALILAAPAGFRPDGKGGLSNNPADLLRALYAYPENRLSDLRPSEIVKQNNQTRLHYHGGMPLDEALVERLSEITALTLILYGTREVNIPIETCRILKQHISGAYLNYLYDAAHFMDVDQPERFAGIVGDFLDRGEVFIVKKGTEAA